MDNSFHLTSYKNAVNLELITKYDHIQQLIKFIYSEKATKFLSFVVPVKGNVEISENFVTFSEYMNFIQVD